MLKTYDVYYHVILSEVCDPHFRPGPDKELPQRYESKEEAEAAVEAWEKTHPTAWVRVWVKEYMDEVII